VAFRLFATLGELISLYNARAPTERLRKRTTKTAEASPRKSQPLMVSRVVKTVVKPTSWNHSQSV
jgi:hypothetical protein